MIAPPSYLAEIPGGLAGVRDTLRIMSSLVNHYKKSPLIRHVTVTLTANFPQKDFYREVDAIHKFVRDQIRYVRDIRKVETLQTPEYTLINRVGDCDDKSVLAATMLESIGHPTRFVAVGFQPKKCSHVFTEVKIGGKGPWIPVETTEPVILGWKPPNIKYAVVSEN